MKVAYICVKDINVSGGVEKYTWEMATRIAPAHSVYIYATRRNTKISTTPSVEIIYVPSIKKFGLEKLTGSFFATIRGLLNEKVDLFHYQAFGASVFSLIPRLFGKVSIAQAHGIEWKRAKWGKFAQFSLRIIELISVYSAKSILTVSKVQSDDIFKRYGIKTTVISGGVSLHKSVDSSVFLKKFGLKTDNYFLFAARLVPEKGAAILISAFKRANLKNIKLAIAGTDENQSYVKSLADMAGDSVVFLGHCTREELSCLYKNAYAYVSPSELEGLSLSLLDALGYECRCICSDIPENMEAIHNGMFGISFKVNDESELAKILGESICKSNDLKLMAKAGGVYIRTEYSWDVLAIRMKLHYDALVSNG